MEKIEFWDKLIINNGIFSYASLWSFNDNNLIFQAYIVFHVGHVIKEKFAHIQMLLKIQYLKNKQWHIKALKLIEIGMHNFESSISLV